MKLREKGLDKDVFGETPIKSILDTDVYVLNMMSAIMHQCNDFSEDAEFEFIVRSDIDLSPYVTEIRDELEKLSRLYLTDDQKVWLCNNLPWLKNDFFEYLRLFRFNLKFLNVFVEKLEDGTTQLGIKARGPALNTTPFEVPVLATVSEVYNRNVNPHVSHEDIRKSVMAKVDYLNERVAQDPEGMKDFRFADFGTRRRFSFESQRFLVEMLSTKFPKHFVGTSNVHLAREYNIRPIGTMAHLYQMLFQQSGVNVENSVLASLESWVKEFRGELGYALTDTLTFDHFLKGFDKYYAKLFDGLRQDSGCPYEFAEKAIAHYEKLGINPKTKVLIFSDGLDLEMAIDIYYKFKDRIMVSFGIGTFLTNSIEGVKALSIVMKLVRVNGKPVCKISDTPAKAMCKEKYFLDYVMRACGVKE